jgi:kynureninase
MLENPKHFFDILRKNSVMADLLEPNVIRVAPVPLYNTFEDVYTFGQILRKNIN